MTIHSEDLISYWQREIKDSTTNFGTYNKELANLKNFLKAAIDEGLVYKGEKVTILWESESMVEFREGCKNLI